MKGNMIKILLTFGTISACSAYQVFTGKQLCMVTGNQLIIAYYPIRYLTEKEMQEAENHKEAARKWREDYIEYTRLNSNMDGDGSLFAAATPPEQPKKPSFCLNDSYTNVEFDFGSCSVMNNKVYVRFRFIRDLTPDEIEKLKVFYEGYKKQISKETERDYANDDEELLDPDDPMFCTEF